MQLLKNKKAICSHQGQEPLALKETLEQLHRLLFVLAFVHVSYSFISIVLALVKVRISHWSCYPPFLCHDVISSLYCL